MENLIRVTATRRSLRVVLALLIAIQGLVALPAGRVLAANSNPVAFLNVPADALIGESVGFTVSFDNTGTAPGYGPFVDLALPRGADGAGSPQDGLTFTSASYLGISLTPIAPSPFFCPPGGTYNHPLMPTHPPIPCTPNDQIVILQLPFGSFTPNQPPAPIQVNAQLSNQADLNTPLTVTANAGFIYGDDPLDNPVTDPPIFQGDITPTTAQINPLLYRLKKTYIGPENETATGPNFPRQFQVQAEIAPSQVLSGFVISDTLPNNLVYLGIDSAATVPGGYSILVQPPTGVPSNPPNNVLRVQWPSVSSAVQPTLVYSFYIPLDDANSQPVLPQATGAFTDSINLARSGGTWDPIDSRDPIVFTPAGPVTQTIQDQSIAIQKSVQTEPNGPKPGQVLTYTLNFQVSDFFAFQNVVISDTISDGQRFDPSFIPTMSINGNQYTLPALAMAATNVITTPNFTPASTPPNDGTTEIDFLVSAEQVTRGRPTPGRLVGGCIDPINGTAAPDCTSGYNDGPTTGQIVFRTVIQDSYSDVFPSGDPSVDQGDKLTNSVIIRGDVLDRTNSAFTPTGSTVQDDSGASVTIVRGGLQKGIYAINGSTSFVSPVKIKPGDDVTYVFTYTLPSSDVEGLAFFDYLPLPVFDVNRANGTSPFNTAFIDTVDATVPPAGRAKWGPADTYRNLSAPALNPPAAPPTVTLIPAENAITFELGTHDDPANRPSVVQVLLTVKTLPDPFADGLFLTNQVRAIEANTFIEDQTTDSIVQIQLTEPNVQIKKGVVATTNPIGVFTPTPVGPTTFTAGGFPGPACPTFSGTINSTALATNPIDSNLSQIDAGDIVRFAIVLESRGSSASGAFDVVISDTIPAGFTFPSYGSNLCVMRGDGTVLNVGTGFVVSGTGLFDPAGGIELVDAPTAGALGPYSDTLGSNIVIVTYDLQLRDAVGPRTTHQNVATLINYAGVEGGPDHTTNNRTDDAIVTTRDPRLSKGIVGTNWGFTAGNNVAVGEIVTYTVTITVPQGSMTNTTVVDTLPLGMAFVDCLGVTGSTGLTSSIGALGAACNDPTNPVVVNPGRVVTYTFGTVTSATPTTVTLDSTISLTYTAVVLNVAQATRGQSFTNNAALAWGQGTINASAPSVTVVEPTLRLDKTANPTGGDSGDLVTFVITMTHAPASNADSFNAVLTDLVPSKMTYEPASLNHLAGLAPTTLGESGGLITAGYDTFALGQTTTLQFQARLNNTVVPGEVITNVAAVVWSSLPGDYRSSPQSPYNNASIERDGSNPGGVDSYRTTDPATVTVFAVAPVKSIVATSETATGPVAGTQRVAIGEIVRYRLQARIIEGSITNFQLRDRLPAGMRFLDDGTARVAFVSTGGLITSSTLSGAGLNVIGDETTVNGVTPTFVLPAGAISGGPFGSGTDVTFSLGDLINGESDSNQELIVLEFNALVENIAGNTSGMTRGNDFQVLVGGIVNATSAVTNVVVAEPVLAISKVIIPPAPTDAGDQLNYLIVVTNTASGNNAAPAFDLVVTDTVSSFLDLTAVNVTASAGVTADGSGSALGVGGTVTVTIDRLNPGQGVTITVNTSVVAATPNGQTIPNAANLRSTSLPGPNGTTPNPTGSTTPGASGVITGERVVAANANVNTTLATPTIVKFAPSPITYTIGAMQTWDLVITLPEGNTQNLVVTDTLPTGLGYVSHQLVTTAAGGGGRLAADYAGTLAGPLFTNGSPVLTFDFGTPSTTADNVTNNNSVLLQITTRVLDLAGNVNGTILTNTAALRYTNPNTGAAVPVTAPPVSIRVVEPQLVINKRITPSGAAANDTITITFTVTNTGTSTAHNVVIDDPMPDAKFTNQTAVGTPGGFAFNTVSAPPNTIVRYTGGDILVGQTLYFTFTARLTTGVVFGEVLNNVVTVTQYSTLPGADPNERTEPPVQGQAPLTVTAPDIAVAKTDNQSVVTPGQLLTYTIVITNIGTRDATGVLVTDTIPLNATYVAASASNGGVYNGGTRQIVWPAFDLAVGASVTRTYQVTLDTPLPAGVTAITNTVTAFDDGGHGADPTPVNNTATDVDTVNAAPDLTVTKSDNGITAQPGDRITYTINYTNVNPAGNQAATNVVLTETVPANTTFVGPGTWTQVGATTQYTINVGTLNVGQSGSLQFIVQVNGSLPSGVNQINNTVVIGDDGTNGPDQNPANNTGGEVTPIAAQPDLGIVKSDGGIAVAPGERITYTLVFTNYFNQDATGVVLTETLPANTTFVGVPAGWTQVGASNQYTYNWGNLGVGASGTLTFVVVVDSIVPAGVSVVTNVVAIADDGANGPETVTSNNVATDTTPIIAAPDLLVLKDDGLTTVVPGQIVTYTIQVQNAGNQQATGIVLTETLPANTTFVSPTGPSGWFQVGASNVYTYFVDQLIGRGPFLYQFVVQVNATIPAGVDTLTNTVRVGDDGTNGPDPTPANNTATDVDIVNAQPELTIVKTDNGVTAVGGGLVTYTIVYSNAGNQGASGVVLTETLPTFTSFVGPAGWIQVGATNQYTYAIGILPASVSGSVQFVVRIVPLPAGVVSITNVVVIDEDGTNGPEDPSNNSSTEDTPVIATPDLQIAKSDGDVSGVVGGLITYAITYSNTGSQEALNVVITETVPTYTSFVGPASWQRVGTTNQYTQSVGNLVVGAGGTLTFVVRVTNTLPAGVNLVTNTVTIADDGSQGPDPTPANNSAQDTTPLSAAPDLRISKTDQGITTATNGLITYTLVYSNVGVQDATGVVLTETVPANTTFVGPAGWTQVGTSSQYLYNAGTVAVNASGAISFVVQVNSSLPAGVDALTNSVTIADDGANGADPTPQDNSATETTPIVAAPDLRITKTDGGVTAQAGGLVTYTLTYSNVGTQGATGIVLTETVPANTTFAGPAGWTQQGSSSTYLRVVGDLATGASGQAIFIVRLNSPLPVGLDAITNTVVIADDGRNGPDPTPADNSAAEPTPIVPAPDLRITKTPSAGTYQGGAVVVFTLAYSNTGPVGATGVVVTETVPVNSTFVAGQSTTGWSCADNSGAGTTCRFDVGSLASGGSGTLRFAVRLVNPLPAGFNQLVNVVRIADDGANGPDPTPDNGAATASVPLAVPTIPGCPTSTPIVYHHTPTPVGFHHTATPTPHTPTVFPHTPTSTPHHTATATPHTPTPGGASVRLEHTPTPIHPTATPVHPTATPVHPTATPIHPTGTPLHPTATPDPCGPTPTATPVTGGHHPTVDPHHLHFVGQTAAQAGTKTVSVSAEDGKLGFSLHPSAGWILVNGTTTAHGTAPGVAIVGVSGDAQGDTQHGWIDVRFADPAIPPRRIGVSYGPRPYTSYLPIGVSQRGGW